MRSTPVMSRHLVLAVVAAVVAGLLIAAPAHGASKSRLSLAASAKKITIGKKITFTTKAARGQFRRGDAVRLQQRVGRTWRTVRTTRLDRGGRSKVAVTPELGTTTFRAARAGRSATTASVDVPVVVVRAPSSISLVDSDTNDLFVGSTLHLTGTAGKGRYDIGDPVSVEVQDDAGRWAPLGLADRGLDRRGRVDFRVEVTSEGVRRFRLVKEETDRWQEATSQEAWTNGRAGRRITLASDVSEAPAGEAIPLRGHVDRASCADVDELERSVSVEVLADDGQWTWVHSAKVDVDCDFSAVTRARPGTRYFRVRTGNISALGYGTSNDVAVRVTDERPLVMEPNERATTFFVDEPEQVTAATFSAQRGQKYALAAADGALFHGTDSLRVLDPQGIAVPLDSAPLDPDVRDDHATRWDFVAASTGTFTVQVDPSGESTGHVALQLSTPATTSMTPGAPSAPVTVGDVPGRELRLTFSAGDGDLVGLSATKVTHRWDPAEVRLVDASSGQVVPRRDGRWPIDHDGAFRFEVEPKRDDAISGDVSVLVARAESMTANRPIDVSIDRPDIVRRYRLEGLAGRQLSTAVTQAALTVPRGDTGSSPMVELRSSRGDLMQRVTSFSRVAELTVPSDGIIEVEASAPGRGVGTFRLDLSTPKTAAVELDGDPVTLTSDGLAGRELGVQFTAQAGDVVWPELRQGTVSSPLRQDLINLTTGEVVPQLPGMDDYDVWTIPSDGFYRLEHATIRPEVLEIDLRVRRATPLSTPLDLDRPTTVTVAPGQRITVLRIDPTRDETLSLGLRDDSIGNGQVFASRSSRIFPDGAWTLAVPGSSGPASARPGSPSTADFSVRAGAPTYVVLDAVRSGSLTLEPIRTSRRTVTGEVNGSSIPLSDGQPLRRTTTVRFEATAGQVLSLDLGSYATYQLRLPLRLRTDTGEAVDSICFSQRCDDEGDGDPVWLVPATGTYELSFELGSRPTTPVGVSLIGVTPQRLENDGTARRLTVDRPGGTAAVLTTMPWWEQQIEVTAGSSTFSTSDGPVRVPALVVDPGPDMRLFWRLTEGGSSVRFRPSIEPERTLIVVNPPRQVTGSVDLLSRVTERQ